MDKKRQEDFTLDNTIFEVQNGAYLNVNGSSDVFMVEQGAGALSLTGSGNTVVGSSVSGASVSLRGSGNTVSLGDNAVVGNRRSRRHR